MLRNGKATLSEIARQAQTSTMAVSVVLNGARSNTRVSEETRRRIETVAKDLNYSPNAQARSLKRQRTETLGVLFTWAGTRTIHNLYSMSILDGIVASAATQKYHVLLYTQSWENPTISSATFADQRTDGIIVVAPLEGSDVVSSLTSLGVPVAVISSTTDVPSVPCVGIDNRLGVQLALDHLHGLGHTRIGYVGHLAGRYSMRMRHDVYREWMQEHNLPVPEDYILLSSLDDTPLPIERLLRLPDPPTAIFAATDDLAVEVLDVARTIGVSVPEQLSVVGFDDTLVAGLTTPKLTTIRQPLFEMGQLAAKLLIAHIQDQSSSVHVISPELIVRDSTAKWLA
jgi:DNA-binding LacI/PurR family transcriptional regulator